MSQDEISIKRILVPIDGSDASLKAAKYAIKTAKCEHAQVMCMHVIAVAQNTSEYVGKPEVYYDRLRKAAQSWFEEIKKVSRNMGVSEAIIATDIVTDFSSIPEAIINYASSKNADLIVMGTKGKTGLKRFLMGSVADSVVRHAYGPVFVVR